MATAQTAKSSNGKTAPTGKVVDEKPNASDHVIAGAADGWDAVKKAATSDMAKLLATDAARGAAMGLGVGIGLLIVDHAFN